jgi:hypothetical protein
MRGQVMELVDIRRSERRAPIVGVGVRISPWPLQVVSRQLSVANESLHIDYGHLPLTPDMPQVSQCSAEAHNLSLPGATPGPATEHGRPNGDRAQGGSSRIEDKLCGRGRCPTGPHKAGEPGSIPGPATTIEYANWQSGEVESLVIL